MFQIDDTLVSEDIITKDFVCNLSACKGSLLCGRRRWSATES